MMLINLRYSTTRFKSGLSRRNRGTLASHDTREERGMSFAVVGRRSFVRMEEKWVVSQRTIVTWRERTLRTPSSYSAERGPRSDSSRSAGSFPIVPECFLSAKEIRIRNRFDK